MVEYRCSSPLGEELLAFGAHFVRCVNVVKPSREPTTRGCIVFNLQSAYAWVGHFRQRNSYYSERLKAEMLLPHRVELPASGDHSPGNLSDREHAFTLEAEFDPVDLAGKVWLLSQNGGEASLMKARSQEQLELNVPWLVAHRHLVAIGILVCW